MVGLRTVVVIFVTLLCRELAGEMQRTPLFSAVVATAGVVLGVGLLFRCFAIVALCQPTQPGPQLLRQLGRHRNLTDWTWCILLPFALLATGWAACLREFELSGSVALAFPGYFLPTLCVILLVEFTYAEFEQTIDEMSSASLAGARPAGPNRLQRLATRLKLGDLTSLLTCMLPVMAMMFFRDLSVVVLPWLLPTSLQSDALPLVIAAVLTFSMLALLYPLWMSKLVGAVALREQVRTWEPVGATWAGDGTAGNPAHIHALSQRIEGLLHSLAIAGLSLKLVPSQNRWSGAAVVGWFPACRHLWLGDRLIKDLTREELDMVVLHELAHVKRWHFAWRMGPVLAIAGLLLVVWLSGGSTVADQEFATSLAANGGHLLVWGLVCTGMLAAIGWIARRCELDADRTACRLAAESCDWTRSSRQTAAHLLASALVKVHDSATAGGSWLHPSLQKRLHNLGIEHN